MGNTLYAEALIGMTVPRAKRFITENYVYFDINNTKYRIMHIRKIVPDSLYTMEYCPTRISVETKNDIIIKILSIG